MGRLRRYIRPYYGFIALTMFIKFIGSALELLIPYFMEIILDDVIPAGQKQPVFTNGLWMFLCVAGCLAGNVIANRMSAVSSGKITRRLRHDLFDRLQRLSSAQMDDLTVSSAESRLTSDTYNVNNFLARMQRLGIRAPILLIGGLLMMLKMDAFLSLIMLCMLPFIALIVYLVTKKSVPLYTKEQFILDEMVRVLQENITGIRVIKALSKTEYEKQRFEGVNERLTKTERRAELFTNITNPATTLILNLGLTMVVLVGAFRVQKGLGQSGVIIAFLQYFVMIMNAMLGVTRIFILWSKGEASANRVMDVLDIEPDMGVLPADKPPEVDAPHIVFEDVTFSYNRDLVESEDVGQNLSHISFTLNHGDSLGIIGATGSGKSTLIRLLMRLYDPTEGRILIDGRDIRTMATEDLKSRFGVVFQNDFVMAGTIGDNIRFFRDIDAPAMRKAAEEAQAAEFIEQKEGRYAAEVAVRGNNLSGGQKQRLLIARALAADPEILILDDASSALDYRTDADLRRALKEHHASTTTITIAQRVSSIRGCSRILVLNDGKPIGFGTHDELMAQCEEYRIIAKSQMGDEQRGR